MTDEVILEGFRSLHAVMAAGFDRIDRRFEELERKMDRRFAEFDARMMRRFDERDTRLDNHEHRIAAIEAKT